MKIVRIALIASIGILFWWWSTTSTAQTPGFRVIVHPDNPVTSMSKDTISDIFLKKAKRWDHDNLATVPVDLDSDSPIRESFSRDVHGRSVSSIKNYWQRQIFSGRDVPPRELTSERDVVTFVGRTAGAIGYVSNGQAIDGVKVVEVTQ